MLVYLILAPVLVRQKLRKPRMTYQTPSSQPWQICGFVVMCPARELLSFPSTLHDTCVHWSYSAMCILVLTGKFFGCKLSSLATVENVRHHKQQSIGERARSWLPVVAAQQDKKDEKEYNYLFKLLSGRYILG